jgi:hypothetical protein
MSLPGIELSSSILVGTTKPVDSKYGPFEGATIAAAKTEALTNITAGFRFEGLTAGLILFSLGVVSYISTALLNDLRAAREEGNPYFTPHLIPTINISQFNLKQLVSEFNAKERIWGFEITNSLGTETGPAGEIEIVKYIDTLLYDDPIGESNEFELPYRRGTIIASHLFSQNPPGFALSGTDSIDINIATGTDDASLADLFNQSNVGSYTNDTDDTDTNTQSGGSTSTTTSGLVFSLSKLLRPLILISNASPGFPAVFVTTTPAICP